MYKKSGFRRRGVRRGGRRVGMRGAAKVYAPKKAINVSRLQSKVNGLIKKQRKETEMKKYYMSAPISNPVGQVNANGSGVLCQDITSCMAIAAGVGAGDRQGLKCNLKGIFLRYQIQQQSALAIGVKYVMDIYKTSDVNIAVGTFPGTVYNVDTMSGVIDYNSTRSVLYRKVYQKIYSKTFYIPADSLSGSNNFIDNKVLIKQRQLLEWPTTASSNPQNVRYLLVVRASAGNLNTSTASTLSLIPLTAVNTGATFTVMASSYFTD